MPVRDRSCLLLGGRVKRIIAEIREWGNTQTKLHKQFVPCQVVSDTEVTASVPARAKTGKIAVATNGVVATSTTSFTVN